MTVSPSPHPSALELSQWLDGALDRSDSAAIEAHYRSCVVCQAVVADARSSLHPVRRDAVQAPMTDAPLIPDAVRRAMGQPRGGRPRTGQLWRLEWDGWVTLALVLDIQGEGMDATLLVAPVTTEIEAADQYTLVVAPERSPLELPLAVWVALRTHVPLFTLDRMLGQTDVTKYADELHGYFLEDRRYIPDAEGLSVGLAVVSRADARWAKRDEVAEVIGHLSDAGEQLDENSSRGPLGELVRIHGVGAAEVGHALGLIAGASYQLLSGHVPPSEQQASLLALLLDVQPRDILRHQQAAERDLRLAWAEPDVRDEIDRVTAATGRSVRELRDSGTQHVFALAARETGTEATGINAWKALILDWLNAQA